ncbi:MAG TPA: hypothetical protein H9776_04490 [Candidatus Mediterraneibacter intestinipullorum]|nr:hypothetical protein [Candidatus Mediterraneibacter intestinipullorum]
MTKNQTRKQRGLDVIPVKRRTAARKNNHDVAPVKKKENPAVQVIEIVAAISMMLNVIQSVIIYILQVGPI